MTKQGALLCKEKEDKEFGDLILIFHGCGRADAKPGSLSCAKPTSSVNIAALLYLNNIVLCVAPIK